MEFAENEMEAMNRDAEMTRRRFLQGATAAALGAGLLYQEDVWGEEEKKEGQAEKAAPRKRVLGRTGLEVTDISFGGMQIQQERLLDLVIDRGINLIHTAPGYVGGKSIRFFGNVMKRRRKEVFLALKESPIRGIDEELRILNTDHVDILVPPLHSVEAMQNPELPGAYEKLKKEGKIRFSGFACHRHMKDVMNLAVDLGYFDVMLIAYNLGNREELDPVLARAKKEQNMGFMAMKSTKDLGQYEGRASALTALLQNANVDTLLVGMSTFAEVEQNAAVSGRKMGWRDRLWLREHAHLGATACAMCGACDGCPQGVAVADILRCGIYAERGERELAVATYRGLDPRQSAASCDGCGACERACPRSRPVRAELRELHQALA